MTFFLAIQMTFFFRIEMTFFFSDRNDVLF
jgi:hypothetical protein